MSSRATHKRTPSGTVLLLAFCILPLSLGVPLAQAVPPRTFVTTYDASYEGIGADAQRSLTFEPSSGKYTLSSTVELTLFGSSLTRIDERSEFLWVDEKPLPQHYEFTQRGFGSRSRSVDFDQDKMRARFRVNDNHGSLKLDGPAFDDLSGYLVAKEQLTQGAEEVRFNIVDRGEIREHYYKVVDRQALDTPLGHINAVHLERVRAGESGRKTEIWLAQDHDYLLLKLLQTEPDGGTIELNIHSATLGDHVLSKDTLEAAASAAALTPNAAPSP